MEWKGAVKLSFHCNVYARKCAPARPICTYPMAHVLNTRVVGKTLNIIYFDNMYAYDYIWGSK